ncbi:MAG: ABC transporter substrate-binding protein [Fimbriimonas sp.]|nr:ABC transporter substrate-binding protein [Fimbriimonas sp.]
MSLSLSSGTRRKVRASRDLIVAGITTFGLVFLSVAFGGAPDSGAGSDRRTPLRLAFFPNVTHAPALVGMARGDFQEAAVRYRVEPKVVNAGPEAMEALLAGEVDFAYVGPSPAVNAYLKSGGKALVILSGACSGGASLIARGDESIRSVSDLDGKRVAVPQLGGTQDVSLRHFLAANGLAPQDRGGSVQVLPVKNPDILALFIQKQIDAAWVPEPWASRLRSDADAKNVVDERDLWPNHRFTTTVLVARKVFAEAHPDAVRQILAAHRRSVDWLRNHPDEAAATINQELKLLSGKAISMAVLRDALGHVQFTTDLDRANIVALSEAAAKAGYLKEPFDLSGAFDPTARDAARVGGKREVR